MRMTLLAVAVLVGSQATAQITYTVCGQEEFCICWDGTAATVEYTFVPCLPLAGQLMAIVTCSGDVAVDVNMLVYDGVDSTYPLVYDMPSGTTELPTISLAATSDALHMQIFYGTSSSQSCSTGDDSPWRFLVITGASSPLPGPGDCTGSGPSCGPMSIDASEATEPFRISYSNGALVSTTPLPVASMVELRDMSGRLIERQRVQGEQFVPLRASFASGTYLVTLLGAAGRESQLIAVP